MTGMCVLTPGQESEWADVLARSCAHDAAHLPQYHALAERHGEGEARLFVYTQGAYTVALPLLLRRLEGVAGLGPAAAGRRDAASVSGYAGPVASHADVPGAVRARFREALGELLRELGVVTVCARLHPLLSQAPLLAGLGECRPAGETVSVDLTLSAEARQARYRRTHRQSIGYLRQRGAVCVHDERGEYLGAFTDLYHETMRRVRAAPACFFGRDYFRDLLARLGTHAHLFVGLLDGEVTCGALVLACRGVAQVHLAGTREAYLSLAPNRFLVDGICDWGGTRGLTVLHLGGGAGVSRDALFRFKAGFSDRRHPFCTWCWVVLPEAHQRLCAEARRRQERERRRLGPPDYFPVYRTPAVALM